MIIRSTYYGLKNNLEKERQKITKPISEKKQRIINKSYLTQKWSHEDTKPNCDKNKNMGHTLLSENRYI